MFVLVRRNPFANPDVQLEGPWGLTIEICGVRLIHPIYSMDADIPAVVGIDLLTAAKLVIDVMNRCVYSHHHARLEIEPVLSNCEPVFRVDNATHFQSHPISSSASCPPSSGTPTASQDFGGPSSSSGAGAPLVSLHSADALERPSPLAPVPLASLPTTGDSLHQDDVPLTCCVDHQLLQPPPPSFSLSPSAPPFYPPASAPHYHPPVRDLSVPTTIPVQPPTTSSPLLPSDLHPPVTVIQPPPPPDPPDLPVPPPDPPQLQDLQTPRSCPSYPLSPADRSDADITHLKTVTTELPEHVNLLFLQTVENSQFPSQVRQGLKDLLSDYAGTFAKDSTDLGYCDVLQHDIDTGDARPIKQSPRRLPLAACTADDQIFDEMLESGVIEPSCSPLGFACMPRQEKGGHISVLRRLQKGQFCVEKGRISDS